MGVSVSIQQVVKNFGSLRALDGVSLEIAEGEFFGLLGPNGAGKTTLISCLAGLVRPDQGRLSVMGCDVLGDYRAARRRLGVVPQELVFDPFFSVRETLRIQSGYFGLRNNDKWIDEILENLDLTAKADTNMRRLSVGMKWRVLVAQALVHKPPVIVLDEPTAGVDVELRQGLWQFVQRLNREGHTVILTTHYLEEAEALCGRIAMLKQGRVVALDSTNNLLARFAGHTLNLRLADAATLPPALRARATQSGTAWVFRLACFNEIEPLLAAVREAGGVIDDLRLSQTDLEDFFVGVMQGAGVLAVTCWMAPLSFVAPFWILAFAMIGGGIMGSLGTIAGIWADKFDQLAGFQNFLIMPLTMLSGVFYSIHSLPPFWQRVSHFNPVFSYMIDGFRFGFFGVSDVAPATSFAVVVSFLVVALTTLSLLRSGYKLRY